MRASFLEELPRLALVGLAGAAVYLNTLGHGFVWDDVGLIVENPYVKGWHNLPGLLTADYWASEGGGGLYRPLTTLTFLAEHSLAGLSPFLYHVDNLLLHVAVSLTVYFLIRELSDDARAALFAALVFAVHPVHAEAVAYVSGRAELLGALFFLASLYTFIRPPGSLPRYLVSPALFALGLLSKETAGTLPLFILLYLLIIRKGRGPASVLKSLSPYLAVLAVYLPLRWALLGGQASPVDPMFGGVKGWWAFLVMLKALMHYIRLAFFPTDLRLDYMFAPPGSVLSPGPLIALALAAALALATPRLYRRSPMLLFFAAWFFAALLPVSNIIPTKVIMTERALYLPTVGSCALVGYTFAKGATLVRRWQAHALFAALVISCASLTVSRNAVWKDQATVTAGLERIYAGVVEEFPGYASGYMDLARVYMARGETDKAVGLLDKVVSIDPEFRDARHMLGSTHASMAAKLHREGDDVEAERHMRAAVEAAPDDASYRLNHGFILSGMGRKADALSEFVKAGELDPALYEAPFNEGLVRGELGDYAGSARALGRAAGLRPDDAQAQLFLGAAYEGMGRTDEARERYRRALELDPGLTPARTLYEKLSAGVTP